MIFCLLGSVSPIVAVLHAPALKRDNSSAQPMHVADAANGSVTLFYNCDVVNCTLYDTPEDPLPRVLQKAKRAIDTNVNPNARVRGLAVIHINGHNAWYFRLATIDGGQSVSVLRLLPPAEPSPRPTSPRLPNQALDSWGVDFLIPPWIVRQFGMTAYEPLVGAGEQVSLERLLLMFSPELNGRVDQQLRQILNGPDNLIGGDRQLLRLRGMALSARHFYERVGMWRNEDGVDARVVRMLQSMEADLENSVENVLEELARRLEDMFYSRVLGDVFRRYVRSIYGQYRTQTFTEFDWDAYFAGRNPVERHRPYFLPAFILNLDNDRPDFMWSESGSSSDFGI